MCAVFGIVGEFDEALANRSLLLLSHRGPDFCGVIKKKNLFFTHQRLSISDLHHRSNQPLESNTTLLSFNGEIYNYKILREKLSNFHRFKTNGDAEVVFVAYKRWGADFVQHLRGMFSIAILDGDVLHLFRDRLGKKPMFFMQNKNSFIFASEIKAILPHLKHIEMDNDALLSYISFLAPTPPYTFFKDIKKLGAGEHLIFHKNSYSIKSYYNMLDINTPVITDETQALQKIEDMLSKSIEIRLDSDVEIASLLSGGIDSATINYYAKKHSKPMQTYTIGYREFAKYDERKNAKLSAEFLGIENKHIEIDEDIFIDSVDKVFDTLDEPLNDPASIPLYILFENIKNDGFRVVLSGEGSDELFLGYRQYFEFLDIEQLKHLKRKNWLKRYFKQNFSQNREWEYYKRVFEGSILFRTSGETFTDTQKNLLFKKLIEDNHSLKYLKKYTDEFESSKFTDESIWYSYIDLKLFQAEHFLTKLDRVSMAHSIESRTPFLDHKLVELVFSLDCKLRYQDGVTKSLLKKVMKNKLDDDTLNRRKKGFSNPYMEYIINSGRISLIQEVNKQTGLFKEDILSRYIKGAKSGNFKHHVWGLYTLSHWIKKYLL